MIRELQREHKLWLDYNFPKQKAHQPLLGLVEEVGELAHAHLKFEQGIREGTETLQEILALKADAVGDIFIYLMSYCNSSHIDLEGCIRMAWAEVKRRDWIKDPQGGSIDA
jgi:NTP pyrophosphatase (non-canonical NTP hydrolase)